MHRYSFNITWSEEDGEYVATCPAFPGLSALGKTEAEALLEGKVALELFIESYLADSIPLPLPEVVHEYSGQFRVRLPKSLHRQASELASSEGVSLNQFVANAVAIQVGATSYHNQLLRKLDGYLARHADKPPLRYP